MSITPNMLLVLPEVVPSNDATKGPKYASLNSDAFLKIDSHNHQIRRGVRLPSAAILFDEDWSLNEFNITSLRAAVAVNQVAPLAETADVGCLTSVDGDLWFNDGSLVAIQITDGSAINSSGIGTIEGDYSSSSASVYYTNAAKSFFFTSDTNEYALMEMGALSVFASGVSSNAVTLSAPSGLSSDYGIELFDSISASTKLVTLDAAGKLRDDWDVDGTTVGINSNQLRIVPLSIGTSQLADASVTEPKISATNIVFGTGSGSYLNTSNSTWSTICSVSITTSGRMVTVVLQPDGNGEGYYGGRQAGGVANASVDCYLRLLRNGTVIANSIPQSGSTSPTSTNKEWTWGLDYQVQDFGAAAGTNLYQLQGLAGRGGASPEQTFANNCRLVAIESMAP